MSAAKVDWSFEQGTTVSKKITYNESNGSPRDFTGWTLTGKMRTKAGDSVIAATFSFTFNTPRTDGIFFINLTNVQSAAVTCDASESSTKKITKFSYDVHGVDGSGAEVRLIEGTVSVSPSNTNP